MSAPVSHQQKAGATEKCCSYAAQRRRRWPFFLSKLDLQSSLRSHFLLNLTRRCCPLLFHSIDTTVQCCCDAPRALPSGKICNPASASSGLISSRPEPSKPRRSDVTNKKEGRKAAPKKRRKRGHTHKGAMTSPKPAAAFARRSSL